MCGIIGTLPRGKKRISEKEQKKALEVLADRGPDGEGIKRKKIWLGHRRLAIIDLTKRADQPMELKCSKTNKNLTLVFNGEIYNYREIRKQLELLRHTFYSNSDTEVILHSYEQWGDDCFEKLRGMFAIAIWDDDKEELIVARDRFGIKPLYYFVNQDFFSFSSEIRALFQLSFVPKQVRQSALFEFLRQGYIAQPNTFYKDIFSLEPGFILHVSKSHIYKVSYADIGDNFFKPKQPILLVEAVEKTKQALLDSVLHHLIADVEIGLFLSGGIDSSALLVLMRELQQEKITTVSAIFPHTSYDESQKIKSLVRQYKTNHIALRITGKDFLNNLESIFTHMDQPTVDGVNTFFVSLAAKHAGLKVILSGLGGDELFYGYPSFFDIPKIIKIGPWLRNIQAQRLLKLKLSRNPFNNKIAKLSEMIEAENALDVYSLYRAVFTNNQIQKILNSEWRSAKNEDLNLESLNIQNGYQSIRDLKDLVSYFEFTLYLRNQLLRDVDAFSMAHSIELRVPFVDHLLLKEVLSIPAQYKMRGKIKKFLLKEVIKEEVGKEILAQKKQGFVLPIELWLKNEAKKLVSSELLSSKIFEKEQVEKLLQMFFDNKLHWSRIWSLFVLNRFLR